MTAEDVKLATIWIVGAMVIAILINAIAMIGRAKADYGDPREAYTRQNASINIDGFSSRRHRIRSHDRPGRIIHQRYAKRYHLRAKRAARVHVAKAEPRRTVAARDESKTETQILPHPVGCPRTAFCGCGAALEVFGRNVRRLWLAANWYEFPRSEPAPGRVAVRNHHVFVIRKVLSATKVLAYDANSGNHQTRLHVRSLAGYSVRDPHAGSRRVAVAQAGEWEP